MAGTIDGGNSLRRNLRQVQGLLVIRLVGAAHQVAQPDRDRQGFRVAYPMAASRQLKQLGTLLEGLRSSVRQPTACDQVRVDGTQGRQVLRTESGRILTVIPRVFGDG